MARQKKQIDHDPIVARFGRRLREVRASRGLTQAQLAEKAEVTISYITRLESGSYAPGIDLVQKLAAALGVTAADLLPAEAPPTRRPSSASGPGRCSRGWWRRRTSSH